MVDQRIVSGLLKIDDLPTLPQVISRIIDLTEDETSSAKDLTAILENDHAISARILRLANSPFYGLAHKVDSIGRAVVLLGFDAVRGLALATTVVEMFARRKQSVLTPEDFWMHSFGAAKAAQMLCAKHCQVASREGCFTIALLHDVGKYLFAIILGDQYLAIVSEAQEARRPLHQAERERLGTDHAELGAWLLDKWCFPEAFRDVIAHLYRRPEYSGPYTAELAVVALAGVLSQRAGFGDAGDWLDPEWDEELLEHLGLSVETVDAVLAEVEPYREETWRFLSLLSHGR